MSDCPNRYRAGIRVRLAHWLLTSINCFTWNLRVCVSCLRADSLENTSIMTCSETISFQQIFVSYIKSYGAPTAVASAKCGSPHTVKGELGTVDKHTYFVRVSATEPACKGTMTAGVRLLRSAVRAHAKLFPAFGGTPGSRPAPAAPTFATARV